jgi:methoxymalonate biosynthesis acyl carrier protein
MNQGEGSPMDIKPRIRSYISRFVDGYDLQDADDIFALGLVNSLFAMQLVMFVEKEFAVTVDSDDMNLDNFRSLEAISDFVVRKAGIRA